MQNSTATKAVACNFGPAATVSELQDIHRASVIRHASILADAKKTTPQKIISYFEDLQAFMENNFFRGCPYSNALAASRGVDEEVVKEVLDHKEFTREFFIALSQDITISDRAPHVGEHLFLLYAGATTESQNLRAIWPIQRSLQIVKQILIEEQAYKNLEQVGI